MQFFCKGARIFWLAAILLMAGGQLIHAYEEFSHSSEQPSERHATESEQQRCPTGHKTCCHGHSNLVGTFSEAPASLVTTSNSGGYFDRVDSVVEGPIREIDYPPQLS